ncbi:MAG: hypothetical protein IJH63_14285 [Methanobrevibacter sp.]|nr:hypothetical protein [Methanosphaera sp.]MBR0370412.1 hypothetical protein [Methanobrevibacter sp.]MBR0371858.1 hypothetical protein [Methanobrevibacter sp.]
MTNDKFDELIEKQVQRENKIRQVREDYLNEMNELPKKQITVKLFPNTHKALKVIATAKDTTLETIATSILESRIERLDIVEYVKESFDNNNDFDWLKQIDIDNSAYDINDKMLDKGNPRKRINVKVDPDTHKKLRVISAIQDRSLDNIVGSVIEYEIGEENNINTSKLMDEILDSIEDAE